MNYGIDMKDVMTLREFKKRAADTITGREQSGVTAKGIVLDSRVEAMIMSATRDDLGELVSSVTLLGARAGLKTFFGLPITWERNGVVRLIE